MKAPMDGGGFPLFKKHYHEYKLSKEELLNATRKSDARNAFRDFVEALDENPNWPRNFTPHQALSIRLAIKANNPTPDGFTWHHHQDWKGEVMQLVDQGEHSATGHYGGWWLRHQ